MTDHVRTKLRPQIVIAIEEWCRNNNHRWLTTMAIEDFLDESRASNLSNLLHLGGWPSFSAIPTPTTILEWCQESKGAQWAKDPTLITTQDQLDKALIYLAPSRRKPLQRQLIYNHVLRDPMKYTLHEWSNRLGISIPTVAKLRRQAGAGGPYQYRTAHHADAARQIAADPHKYSVNAWAELLQISPQTVHRYRKQSPDFVNESIRAGRPKTSRVTALEKAMRPDPYKYSANNWAELYGVSLSTVSNIRRKLRAKP